MTRIGSRSNDERHVQNSFRKEPMTGPTITEGLAHVLYVSAAADIPAAVSCDDYSSAFADVELRNVGGVLPP
jgi:hypothetical protein